MTRFILQRRSYTRNLITGILIIYLALGQTAWAGPPNQGPQPSYPKPGKFLQQIPSDHQAVRKGPDQYYFHKGTYYHPDNGGYRVVRPPRGIVVERLPLGFETLVIAGITYFVLAGIFYQKAPSGYVVVDPPPSTNGAAPVQSVITVNVNWLNVRSGPGLQHGVVHQVRYGTRLEVEGNATGWYYVRLPNGTFGWVMTTYTMPLNPEAKG